MIKVPTQMYRILELVFVSGEISVFAIHNIIRSQTYSKKLMTKLINQQLIFALSDDGVKGYRLTAQSKKQMMEINPSRFMYYAQNDSELNKIKNNIRRRLRVHRLSEIYVMMSNSGVQIFHNEKPRLFTEIVTLSDLSQTAALNFPLFYSSKEFKDIGEENAKIMNSRCAGVLLTAKNVYLTYNSYDAKMKWSSKSELRAKSVLLYHLRQKNKLNQYGNEAEGILFARNIDLSYEFLTDLKKNQFLFDGTFNGFHFLTLDEKGVAILRLLADPRLNEMLENTVTTDLAPPNPKLLMENNGLDKNGVPVLVNYTFNLPKLIRFNTMASLHNKNGIIICFDFQEPVMKKYCCELIEFQTIDFEKFNGRFFP